MKYRNTGPVHSGAARCIVTGTLIHDDPERTPLHNMRIEVFYDDGQRGQHVGRGTSGPTGEFSIPVRLPPRHQGKSLYLRVLELRPPLHPDESLKDRWRVIAEAKAFIAVSDSVRFRRITLPYWEYRDLPQPRVRIDPARPMQAAFESSKKSLQDRYERSQRFHDRRPWELEDVKPWAGLQAATPNPVIPPALTGAGLLRNVFDSLLSEQLETTDVGWVLDLPEGDEPTVDDSVVPGIRLEIVQVDRKPFLASIVLTHGDLRAAFHAEMDERAWRMAIECAASRLRLEELVHAGFGGIHLELERHAIAAHRHLRSSPLATLLMPHLKDVALCNHVAEKWIGKDPFPFVGILPWGREGLAARMRAGAVGRRYDRMAEPTSVHMDHRYGIAGHVVYQAIKHHVTAYLSNREHEIGRNWFEVQRLTEELIKHHPDPDSRGAGDDPPAWAITLTPQPQEGDVERMIDYAVYVLYTAIFKFSWWRDHCLGRLTAARAHLRWRRDDAGRFHRGESPETASMRMHLARTLITPNGDGILDHPNADIRGELIATLRRTDADLRLVGWSAARLHGRVMY